MATKKRIEPVADDERVEVFIPRGAANDGENYVVSVNGVNYVLPEGKKSKVPPHVAWEIQRSFAAQEAFYSRVDALRSDS